ncbi:DUF4365 domain-containing protein [Kineococcus sp. SYSU DK005]|uniref:DUF4365 domain-containing protein n=1 Tax=Kineococcus sp. SYSU DK005 TaxID=3383126 RepID=UPI003D7D51DC
MLETLSERALAQILPPAWTVSSVAHDYGIDQRVEIFDEGRATGLSFLVQLKGTDEDLPAALSQVFKVSALNYMQVQAEPVLVVRYHAPTERLFGFWMHRKNVVLKRDDQKSATLRWELDDQLDGDASSAIQLEVERTKNLREAIKEGNPLRVELVDLENSMSLKLLISQRLRTIGRPFVLVEPGAPAEIRLVVGADRLSADLAISSSSASIAGGTASSRAADLLLLAAVSLGKIGRSVLSAALLRQCWDASLLSNSEIAMTMVNYLAMARAWGTGGRYLSHPSLLIDPGYSVVLTAAFNTDEAVTGEEAAKFSEDMLARSEALENIGELALAAGSAYTAGNLYFHRARVWDAAQACYERALALDPSYGSRPYFCGELAGAMFEAGAYVQSVDWYSRAFELDPSDIEFLATKADALAVGGKYELASASFNEYFTHPSETRRSIWSLKSLALQIIRARTQIGEQDRDSSGLGAPTDVSSFDTNLRRDALHFPSWSWLLSDALDRNDPADLADPLIVIVAFAPEHMTFEWMLLAALALDSGDTEFFDNVVKSQWARRAEDLIEDVVAASDGLPDQFMFEFQRVVDELRAKPQEFTVRHLSGGNLVDMLKIDLSYNQQAGHDEQ